MDNKEKLLKNPKVVEEIKRHLWIESEKVGYDLGFEWAKADWLKRYADAWIAYYLPGKPKKNSFFK